jgi:ribosome-interacting GTPase 1
MPANLTPEYKKAEAEYRSATDLEEKLKWLREMLRVIPKHKGTDHLRGELKKKISQLKKDIKEEAKKGKSTRREFYVEKTGAAQIVLVGAPNVGKSQLLATVTNAEPEVANYMFTTREPMPGMMMCEDVQIELVDLPPISYEYTPYWVPNIIRAADFAFFVMDLGADNVLEQYDNVMSYLEEKKILLLRKVPPLEEQDIRFAYIQTILLATQMDQPDAEGNLSVFKELYQPDLPIIPISVLSGRNLDFLQSQGLLDMLDLIRVYSKVPGEEVDSGHPFVLKRGSNILDFAIEVHKDFAENLNFAKVWGSSKFPGQQVDRDFVLRDSDIVELHL